MSTPIAPSGSARAPNWGAYLGFLDAERAQIEVVKWVYSERAGHDIGWDEALVVWETIERAAWLDRMRIAGIKSAQ